MNEEEYPTIVIDNGSGVYKAGVATGVDVPQVVFPSIVGRPAHPGLMSAEAENDLYVGSDAQNKRNLLNLAYPIERGIISDWYAMEMIWKHTLDNELRVESNLHPVLLADAPLTPKSDREKMTEIMFEKFNIPLMYIAIQGVLSLYASGRTTGVVLDSGYGITHVLPIYEGYILRNVIGRFNLAGRELSEYLTILLNESGYSVSRADEKDVVCDIKEKLCYVALDFEEEIRNSINNSNLKRSYEHPDGHVINFDGNEMFRCPELLFNPPGVSSRGIHKLIDDAIMSSDICTRKELFGNILLNGGSTMFPGFADRLRKEITKLHPTLEVKVVAPPERKYATWAGGSLLTPTCRDWVTKKEYLENGASIVHKKCL